MCIRDRYTLAKRLKGRLNSADPWYKNWVLSLADETQINVGFFNPHLSASMYKWGDTRNGMQNAMDAHRLSDHHLGTPEHPLDPVEKAINFVIHHVPREHNGIRHEPMADWSELEERMAHDPVTRDSEFIRVIARDAARFIQLLESAGKIVPWQILQVDKSAAHPAKIERSYLLAICAKRDAVPVSLEYLQMVEGTPSQALLIVMDSIRKTIQELSSDDLLPSLVIDDAILLLKSTAPNQTLSSAGLRNLGNSLLCVLARAAFDYPENLSIYIDKMHSVITEYDLSDRDVYQPWAVASSVKILQDLRYGASKGPITLQQLTDDYQQWASAARTECGVTS